MTMRAAVAASALLLVLAGCSQSGSPSPSPSDPAPSPSASAAATQSASSAPSASSKPASATPSASGLNTESTVDLVECMSGDYKLARFISVDGTTTGTGQGGDVGLHIDKGDWTLIGAGKDPIKLTLAGQTGNLLVDGTIKGNLRTNNYTGQFTVNDATGTATLGGQTISMQQVATILAPNGGAQLICQPNTLIMLFDGLRLDFER